MKILLLALVIQAGLYAQTLIVGPLLDASGAPANCLITVTPKVNIGSSGSVSYFAVNGDLSGSPGGYGSGIANIWRHAAFQLMPNTYNARLNCFDAQVSTQLFTWVIGGGSMTIQQLLGYVPPSGTLSWGSLTASQWASMPSSQWATMSGPGSSISFGGLTFSSWSTLNSISWSQLTR